VNALISPYLNALATKAVNRGRCHEYPVPARSWVGRAGSFLQRGIHRTGEWAKTLALVPQVLGNVAVMSRACGPAGCPFFSPHWAVASACQL